MQKFTSPNLTAFGPISSRFQKIAILGTGMMGSSVARAIGLSGWDGDLICQDKCTDTLQHVTNLGLTEHTTTDAKSAVKGACLVILAAPVGEFQSIVSDIAFSLKKNCIVTDVGSVKVEVTRVFNEFLPENIHGIPAHPVVGSELCGPRAGQGDLFLDRCIILTPPPNIDKAALQATIGFWRSLGASITTMTPEIHDRVLATTSHLPHLLSYCMMQTAEGVNNRIENGIYKYTAGGFQDLTRISGSDPIMWCDIFLSNREKILDILSVYCRELEEMRKLIEMNNGKQLLSSLAQIHSARERASI